VALILEIRADGLEEIWRKTRTEEDWQAYLAAKKRYDGHVQGD